MPRYIDTEKLTEALREKCDRCEDTRTDFCSTRWCDIAKVIKMIDNAPTADVVERKKGKWIKMSDADGIYYACSECGKGIPRVPDFNPQFDLFTRLKSLEKTNFCPECGADMRGDENDN